MTLPTSGAISLNNVNTELGISSGVVISLGATNVRGLAGVPSGPISMSNLYGKSNFHVTYTWVNSGAAITGSVADAVPLTFQNYETDLLVNFNSTTSCLWHITGGMVGTGGFAQSTPNGTSASAFYCQVTAQTFGQSVIAANARWDISMSQGGKSYSFRLDLRCGSGLSGGGDNT